jgi:ATP-dependent RNA helicase DDX35
VPVAVHPTSVIARFGAPPEWVVFHDVVHTDTILIREVSRIQPMWLIELAEHYYDSSKVRR